MRSAALSIAARVRVMRAGPGRARPPRRPGPRRPAPGAPAPARRCARPRRAEVHQIESRPSRPCRAMVRAYVSQARCRSPPATGMRCRFAAGRPESPRIAASRVALRSASPSGASRSSVWNTWNRGPREIQLDQAFEHPSTACARRSARRRTRRARRPRRRPARRRGPPAAAATSSPVRLTSISSIGDAVRTWPSIAVLARGLVTTYPDAVRICRQLDPLSVKSRAK